jgi:hypothetical protein
MHHWNIKTNTTNGAKKIKHPNMDAPPPTADHSEKEKIIHVKMHACN